MSDEAHDSEPEAEATGHEQQRASGEPAAEEPARPRKRRRRKAEAEPANAAEAKTEAEPTPPAEPDLPAFARAFPRHPALDALVLAFEAGDYARVRKEAPALTKETEEDDVRAAARELLRRLDPDPLAAYLLGIAALLLVFLAGWYWLHPHRP